jgi:hypothetical protein
MSCALSWLLGKHGSPPTERAQGDLQGLVALAGVKTRGQHLQCVGALGLVADLFSLPRSRDAMWVDQLRRSRLATMSC